MRTSEAFHISGDGSTRKFLFVTASLAVLAAVPAGARQLASEELDKLKRLNGDDFTKQYESDRVSAHKDAVNLFGRYLKGGDNVDLKAGGKDLAALQMDIKMAQDLKS
jgi:putative membrane protein